jgi:hypothetical protein
MQLRAVARMPWYPNSVLSEALDAGTAAKARGDEAASDSLSPDRARRRIARENPHQSPSQMESCWLASFFDERWGSCHRRVTLMVFERLG